MASISGSGVTGCVSGHEYPRNKNPVLIPGSLCWQDFSGKHTSVVPESSPLLEEYEKALESQLDHFESVYLIVDALDECRSDDAADFQLDTKSRLLQALGSLGDKIHLLVTSRDESLRTVGLDMDVSFKVMKVTATDGDITAYVEGRIASNTPFRELTGRYPKLKTEVKEAIVAKAAGMFLPAKLYMDFLASKAVTSRKFHVLQALRSLPSFHDKTFEEAYRDAYTGILKGIWEQSPYDVELARKVLSWVVFTKDPQNLTIDIVKQALLLEDEIDEAGTDTDVTDDEFDEIPEEKLLSVCRGLLTVDHHSRTLRFVHYTAEIYFSKPAVQNVDFPNAHEQIAQACLSCILSSTPRGAGCYALDRYASLHWGHHARIVEEIVQPKIQKLFEDEEKMRNSFQAVVAPLPRDWRSKGQAVNSGIKPLHVAAYFGLRSIATTLLERSEDIESKDFRGWDPMRWAIFGKSDALVALLFDHKANLLLEDYEGLPTMFWAVDSREAKQIVSNIVMNGDVRFSLGEISTVRSGQSFATALPSPVLPKTSQSVIKFLLSNLPEVDLDVRSPVDGQTLLSVVAGNWHGTLSRFSLKVERT
ncbi:hypothetical protein PENSUB_12258 [Penicillium subrubescens]|uniref:Nephrocystin 3-like N-terminal domain-containing protein n=1 Tax=Penicillium subrubescens TaxID=1316194 RepID=A0A1Q5T142_9EURO|nr:hypothetical protein PENSUB_12258 [Penicillium subrubescens]